VHRAAAAVGRETELAQLAGAVQRACNGQASCVVLSGEAGVGKTRLLQETATRASERGMAILWGRPPVAAPGAFSLMAAALRSWLRTHRVELADSRYDAGLTLVLPEWPVAKQPSDLDAPQRRLLAYEAVVAVLRAISDDGTAVLVVLDDLHAADLDSLETARYIAMSGVDRVCLLAATRPKESPLADDVVNRLGVEGVAQPIAVQPLDERGVDLLVSSLLGAAAPSPLVADILARTDGVPLYVEEVVHGHLEQGTVSIEADHATWHGGAARVPRTIRELVRRRLDNVVPAQREILLAGAVVGDFEPTLMRDVTGASDETIGAALDAGIRLGLLESVDDGLGYRHAIVRDAVLASAVPHIVDSLHRRAAESLRAATAGDAEAAERLAFHLAAVGADDDSADALVTAARAWLDRPALLAAEHAARLASSRAATPARKSAAADTLASVLAAQGRWRQALEVDVATTAAFGGTPERRLRRAACALEAGQPDLAEATLREAAAAGDKNPQLKLLSGRAALVRGDAAAALDHAERLRTIDDVDITLARLDLEARARDFLDDRAGARDAWGRQASIAAAAGRVRARVQAVVQLGKLELFAGDPPVMLHEAVRLARESGSLVELAWAQENLAIALGTRGDLNGALAVFDEAIDRVGPLQLDQLAYLLAGRAMARSYLVADVEAEIAEAEALNRSPDLLLQTTSMRGDIAMRAGDWDSAAHWLVRSVELGRSMPGVVPLNSSFWLVLVHLAAGREAAAAAALAEAAALPDLPRFHTRRLLLAVGRALTERDPVAVDAAVDAATGPADLTIAELLTVCAHVLPGLHARAWLRRALDIFTGAGAALQADRLRSALRNAGGAVPRRSRATDSVSKTLATLGITAREAEVLRLVAAGEPNSAVATKLYLSVRTVEAHVSSLLRKLNVRNRAELAARAAALSLEDA
jgi:DNA-binding CsgD family transcriptional regulator/tetratricopeptide (TPR) repeat protein